MHICWMMTCPGSLVSFLYVSFRRGSTRFGAKTSHFESLGKLEMQIRDRSSKNVRIIASSEDHDQHLLKKQPSFHYYCINIGWKWIDWKEHERVISDLAIRHLCIVIEYILSTFLFFGVFDAGFCLWPESKLNTSAFNFKKTSWTYTEASKISCRALFLMEKANKVRSGHKLSKYD